MITGPAFIAPHAVHQFRARVATGLTYEQALGAIIRGVADAIRAGRYKTRRDGLLARARGEYPFRAVIVPGDPLPVVVTILRSGT